MLEWGGAQKCHQFNKNIMHPGNDFLVGQDIRLIQQTPQQRIVGALLQALQHHLMLPLLHLLRQYLELTADGLLQAEIGAITAAVPHSAASSNVAISSKGTGRRSTVSPISSASCCKLLLVIDGRIE